MSIAHDYKITENEQLSQKCAGCGRYVFAGEEPPEGLTYKGLWHAACHSFEEVVQDVDCQEGGQEPSTKSKLEPAPKERPTPPACQASPLSMPTQMACMWSNRDYMCSSRNASQGGQRMDALLAGRSQSLPMSLEITLPPHSTQPTAWGGQSIGLFVDLRVPTPIPMPIVTPPVPQAIPIPPQKSVAQSNKLPVSMEPGCRQP